MTPAGREESIIKLVLVAHPCNSSYLGGRDQEDHGFEVSPSPGQIVWQDPISEKKKSQKKGLAE
jgi:hypothetical protein